MSVQAANLEDLSVKHAITKYAIPSEKPFLPPPLVKLIGQYLFQEPTDWIVEWSGPRGYDVIRDGVEGAEIPLTQQMTSLVMQYLRKNGIFGLDDFVRVSGGQKIPFNETCQALRLPDNYGSPPILFPEHPLPLDIDDRMQECASKIFHDEPTRLLRVDNSKITQLYSLFWCPKDISRSILIDIARKSGFVFELKDLPREVDRYEAATDCWIQFPARTVLLHLNDLTKDRIMPGGYDCPSIREAFFCVVMHFAYTGVGILEHSATQCREKIDGVPLMFGYRDDPSVFSHRGRIDEVHPVAAIHRLGRDLA